MTRTEPICNESARYGVAEAAAILGLGRNTMARYIRDGAVRVGMRRVGRHRLFITGREIKRVWSAVGGR